MLIASGLAIVPATLLRVVVNTYAWSCRSKVYNNRNASSDTGRRIDSVCFQSVFNIEEMVWSPFARSCVLGKRCELSRPNSA